MQSTPGAIIVRGDVAELVVEMEIVHITVRLKTDPASERTHLVELEAHAEQAAVILRRQLPKLSSRAGHDRLRAVAGSALWSAELSLRGFRDLEPRC